MSENSYKIISTPEKWQPISEALDEYKKNVEDSDVLVHFMIQVDSFLGFCDARGLVDLKPLVKRLEEVLSESPDDMQRIQNQFNQISEMVSYLANPEAGVNSSGVPVFLERTKDHPKTVVIYSKNSEEAGEVSIQLEHYGYRTFIYTNIRDAIVAAIMTKKADAAIIDFSSGVDESIIKEVFRLSESRIPWVVISPAGNFESRLEMVRAGCSAFFVQPVSASALADSIDNVTQGPSKTDPYRVLIVDDNPKNQGSTKDILNDAGMTTWSLGDPSHILSGIQEFYPDLIILEISQSSCTDIETAKVIRQDEAYASIPIVYLAESMGGDSKWDLLRLGGDDFLAKPIQEEHLIAAITTKAERYRLLRKIMVQDSLTGLLNHTQTKQRLSQALALAKKENKPLCFVMLDIDKFKKVNDTYGHAVGDVVIKSLARLLRQRLRKTDIVGRYGGEEFAVVLYGADGPTAVSIMDRIRIDFSGIYHHYEGGIFASAFSCGIAEFPEFINATELGLNADEALYAAKEHGRNRVVLATLKK